MGHRGMCYPLPSRELIADSIESMAVGHALDGLVLITNCDKITPGMLMAAARLNIPSIMISGGPMYAGWFQGKIIEGSKTLEAIGKVAAGEMTLEELEELEDGGSPGCGACGLMGTANSMNCLSEAIGMSLPWNATVPAYLARRKVLARKSGEQIMELVRRNILPRDILTENAFRNGIAVDMAIGGSTNTVLHLLAIAHEAEVKLDINLFDEISKRTPKLCPISPAGTYYMQDLYRAGGISAVMMELTRLHAIDLGCPTVTGKTVGDNISGAVVKDREVIRPIEEPCYPEGGIAVLWATWRRLSPWSSRGPLPKKCSVTPGPPESLNGKKTPWKPCSREKSSRATSSSSAMKGQREGPACGRCLRRRQRLSGQALAQMWPWSRTDVSRVPRAGPVSATYRLKRPRAGLSPS